MQYRAEIDGLRALAVIPVVLFHAGIASLSGGFVGVDVFFVISGYLISTIILQELDQGAFSLLSFYERRVRRIVPALAAVISACLLASVFLALPAQAEDVARSGLAALLSVSNIYFWMSSGYFAPAADLMPLLHTWSLGVEEQFYLFFPLTLILVHRMGWNVGRTLLLTLPLLFAGAVWMSFTKPAAAFYLLPARAWELALGALLATRVLPPIGSALARQLLSGGGVALIVGAILLLDSGAVFPGWVALAPCAGAALVIHCATGSTLVGTLLRYRPIAFVGLISYSLYLWHWPVLAFSRMYLASQHLTSAQAAVAVALSVLLAILSWAYVERPFRQRTAMPARRLLRLCGAASGALGIGAATIIVTHGLPSRLKAETAQLLSASADIDPLRSPCSAFSHKGRSVECRFGHPSAPVSFVVLGDSHAAAVRGAFDNSAAFSGRAGTLWWTGACPFLLDARKHPQQDFANCELFRQQALKALNDSQEITDVVLAGRWVPLLTGFAPEIGGSYRTYLTDPETTELSDSATRVVFERSAARSIDALVALGKRVTIISAVPEPGFDVPQMLALSSLNGAGVRSVQNARDAAGRLEVDRIFEKLAGERPQVRYVRIWDAFCDPNCNLLRDGVPLYSDDDHITYKAALRIVRPTIDARLAGHR